MKSVAYHPDEGHLAKLEADGAVTRAVLTNELLDGGVEVIFLSIDSFSPIGRRTNESDQALLAVLD